MTHLFQEFAAAPSHPRWEALAGRKSRLYARPDDIRDPFARDYTRVLHSMAYRRLKHKTQVFFNIDNDHICTRMEHVAHVESVSSTIAAALGLNQDLTRAIAMAHDLGHAPFGHQGETVIRSLSQTHLGQTFWHEQNALRFAHLPLPEGGRKRPHPPEGSDPPGGFPLPGAVPARHLGGLCGKNL